MTQVMSTHDELRMLNLPYEHDRERMRAQLDHYQSYYFVIKGQVSAAHEAMLQKQVKQHLPYAMAASAQE